MSALATVLAESGDHFTYGDAAGIFAMLAGFALVIWAMSR
jgi:hypothetical protein